MKLFEEYKKTLKMIEVEEILDLIFYRPLAFVFVKSILRTNLTPNHLTLMAIAFGIVGGILFIFAAPQATIAAGILFIIYDVLDCGDGQLARLKGNGTFFGRILDGSADYIVSTAAYLGIGIGFASHSDNPQLWWILTIAAGISNAFHSSALDFYRNRFLDYALGRDSILGDELKSFKDEYSRLQKEKGKLFEKALIWIYLKYSFIQLKFSSSSLDTEKKKYDRDDFYKKHKLIMHLWTYLGPTTELSFLIICALINRLDIYLLGIVIIGNIIAILLYLYQKNINSSTKLAIQV